ncbi:MAG: hypothetical protein IJW58_03725 [Clostridia bacterium]|nr:hypothetical protein [Clostridia bacterium]
MGLLSEIVEKLLRDFVSLKEDDWIEWIARPNDWQDDCDKFNGCYFIVKRMPKYLQHPNCQCRLEKIAKPIPNVTAKATCDIRKFTEYLFSNKYDDGKKELFESWGYTIADSEYLQQLYVSQAIQKYCEGEYVFKGVGKYYARIEIVIELPIGNGQMRNVKTGWNLLPKGEIRLLTPFSGFAN